MARPSKRATLKDIADKAGVGVATVDRVLNGRAPVMAKTAARVLAAAEDLDYHAHRLIRHRIEQMAPEKTLGFVLQKESKWFYQELAGAIRQAAADLQTVRARVEIAFVESLSPESLRLTIREMSQTADTIGLVSVDHPLIEAAIAECKERGVPVFAILSPLNALGLEGYIGIDGRKAGRTAGWAMSRLVSGNGDIGILVGSHRYLGHEALEVGFRSYMREYAPELGVRDSLVYLDDRAVAYEAATEILRVNPDLAGIYHCGGGVSGVLRALRESGRSRKLAYICHERSPDAVQGLVDGTISVVLATPIDALAENVTTVMANRLAGKPFGQPEPLDFQFLTPENV